MSVMTGNALAAKAVDIAQRRKTIYGYAMYGYQITDAAIASKAADNLNGWYTKEHIDKLKAVANQTPPVWGFDCVNLIKGILWGWTGDETKPKGGAKYGANGVPDTNADGLFGRCRDKTDDFSHIAVGEAVWMSGHIGIYIGDGMTVESTPRWADGVQITAVHNIGKIIGLNGRFWTKHGKLPYCDYGDTPADDVEIPDYALGARVLKRGCEGEDVRELQHALIRLRYNLGDYGPAHDGADGEFGAATQAAVECFQVAAKIEVDGKFGPASLAALKAALERLDATQPEPEPLFAVTIRGLKQADVDALRAQWPEADVIACEG